MHPQQQNKQQQDFDLNVKDLIHLQLHSGN